MTEALIAYGTWVRLRRQALVLTREELASRVGCAEVTIRKIEADERKPSPQIAELLAVHLGVPTEQRDLFVRVARGLLAVEHLPPPIPGALPLQMVYHKDTVVQRTVPERSAGNLPSQVSSFHGREREINDLHKLLNQTDLRLVTLTGPGGVGKTRLALELATSVADLFTDGLIFVNLAPVSDASLVIPTIAQALAVREVAGQSLMACLTTFLKNQQILLILDNFEQLATSAPQIGELLAANGRVKILVTSRVVLNLRGEHEYRVLPLVLPDPHAAAQLEIIAHTAALALFLDRARAVRSTFTLTTTNAPALIAICNHLDGLPLAIELAAARIKILSPELLRERLQDRLAMLTGGARDLPLRQQTIRATIAWSYDLLDPIHQRLFSRLGIFANGCSLEAVESICRMANEPDWDALDALTLLVNSSMIQCVEDRSQAPRFVLLETLRAYALEQLAAADEVQIIAQRHATYYMALAESADPELRGAQQQPWLQRLEAERDNLRIALAWALNGGDMELGVRLAIALWQFWEQGYGNEGRTWLNRASAGSSGVVHTLRARVLLRGGWFGSGDQATAMVEESLALFQELGDRSNMAWAMAKMGHHAWLRSEYAQAITYLEQSLAMFRELGDSRGMASALQLLGDATRDCSETQRAITCLQESVARFRELGDLGGLAFALTGLGDAYYNQDDLVAAHTCFQESAARFQEIGNRYGLPWALLTLGKVAYAQHQFAQAQLLLEDTVARFRSLGHRTALAWSLHHLSATLLMQNADREAQVLLREALELQYIERNKRLIVESLERCVMLQVRQHAFIPAARIGGAAEGLHEREHLPLARADKTIYEREIAALRAQMDTPTLADAWAAGRTLTWQQAADESLAWLEAMGAAEIR